MNNQKKYWDPVEVEIASDAFEKECGELRDKLKELKKDPKSVHKIVRKKFIIALVVTIVFAVVVSIVLSYMKNWSEGTQEITGYVISPFGLFIAYFWADFGMYIYKINNIQKDLVKILIADNEGWLYAPQKRRKRWVRLKEIFPRFFEKGNKGQFIQDEFWGDFEFKDKKRDFWTGIFDYTIEKGSGKNKSVQHYHYSIFGLHLPKKLKADFVLMPEGVGHKIWNFFSRKEINTESSEFNKSFAFYYDGKKVESELEIVKILSPAVQQKILELKKKRGPFSMWIKNDVILVSFKGFLLKKMQTNFFDKVQIDKRDTNEIRKTLNEMFEIGGGIISYLD